MRSITKPVTRGVLAAALILSSGACGGGGPAVVRPVPATHAPGAVTSTPVPALRDDGLDAELARMDELVAAVDGAVDDISVPDTEGDLP